MDGGNATPGSRELARLIDGHGEQLIPDLKHYYNIDLCDLFSESPPSPRWVMLHVNNLPMGSAFVAETRGGYQFVGWDQDRYMMAGLIDAVRVLQHILILCNIDPKARKPLPPEPYPLPDDVKRKKVDAPGSFAFIAKAKLAEAKRLKEAGSGWKSTASSPNASGHAETPNKSTATPITGSESGDSSSAPSVRRGAPQRWKQNSR